MLDEGACREDARAPTRSQAAPPAGDQNEGEEPANKPCTNVPGTYKVLRRELVIGTGT